MKKIITLLIVLVSSFCFGQTAVIQTQKVFPNEKETEKYIKFEINGQKFGERDTIIKIKINTTGFDNCRAIIDNDTLNFITKFKENEIYNIKQGCCCAAFILQAQKNAKRGIVQFKNKTKRDLNIAVCEANTDTIRAGKKTKIFAFESAMCLFKPCSIVLTETEYNSPKYDYYWDSPNRDELRKEQKKFLLGSVWFHFLHGEKIEIFYNETNHKLEVKQNGYLTDKEHLEASGYTD